MNKSLFLLDGMALVYRAHFALIRNPIFTSRGMNTSAVFGFANTLLDILENREPSHVALAMDSSEPTFRHTLYPAYKAQREDTPEDISAALPYIRQFAEAMNIKVVTCPGYEADDIIGTLAAIAEREGFQICMVTPDKDFAQLVTANTLQLKPGRQGSSVDILGVKEICAAWQVDDPARVADILGLWGDSSDNIPGVPGFGEKTAKKLISEYGSLDALLEHVDDLKGKQQESLRDNREQALLSRRLATIYREVPMDLSLDDLKVVDRNDQALQSLLVELEFNALGKRLFGNDFKAGRGHTTVRIEAPPEGGPAVQGEFLLPELKTIHQVPHSYEHITDREGCRALVETLQGRPWFCFDVETDGLDPKTASLLGIAFSVEAHKGWYVNIVAGDLPEILDLLRPLMTDRDVGKIGHNLKFDLAVLRWQGLEVKGPLFDTMIAHFLVEPDRRHGMDALSEQYLGYTPVPIRALLGDEKNGPRSLRDADPAQVADYAAEDADVTWQLYEKLKPLLAKAGQEKVFYEIEMPLVPALVAMEAEGVALDQAELASISEELAQTIDRLQGRIHEVAGSDFNINSPKQMGEVLFDKLKLVDKPKKTRTGQYATNEQVLTGLAAQHEIVRLILEYREAVKLKGTYVDALPGWVHPGTGRIHTSFSQTGAVTGRLASSNPNLQNIPIRTEMGQRIRQAFVTRGEGYTLMSADYSQIELRVMAQMSGDEGMLEAFRNNLDIHTATAAKVYGVPLAEVDRTMRSKAKMVNFGIIYGISAFGLSQRLGIPRTEAAEMIKQYFNQYPAVKIFMEKTIESAREKGYVETLTGRRRTLRDIRSANGTVRAGAERTAINSPIQGTAADMIKLAMARIYRKLEEGGYRSLMILQVHDELVFDLFLEEEATVRSLVEDCMKNALPMDVPILVETGIGQHWLEAH